jgi:hypothetical protein
VSELARGWVITIGIVLGLFVGWFGRGWWDGSSIKLGDAAKESQQFVTAGAKATERIAESTGKASTQRERTRARTEHVEAVTSCPPGLGAVSPDVDRRLRDAFGQASSK